MRVCHLDTCPVGVATQNPELRARFTGKPEFVETFFEYLAQEVRELLAELGYRSIEEIVGRADLLDVDRAIDHWKADGLDLAPVFAGGAFAADEPRSNRTAQDHEIDRHFDVQLLGLASAALERREPVVIDLPIRNTERAVGTMLGHEVTVRHGEHGLPAGTITINLKGTAGQSLGAFVPAGIRLHLEGDANDYVGKGLSGGEIVIRPDRASVFAAEKNVIAGNVIGYGATSGTMFIRGLVGERFLVRNSGATAVVEGVGDHALEYMTGGLAVILGGTGRNFGAGMSGGIAYVFGLRPERVNQDSLNAGELELLPLSGADGEILRDLVTRHREETDSAVATRMLEDWNATLEGFVKVLPRDYAAVIETRQKAIAEGLDPDGEVTWNRIMEVTGG